jgi:hypothetical protein
MQGIQWEIGSKTWHTEEGIFFGNMFHLLLFKAYTFVKYI